MTADSKDSQTATNPVDTTDIIPHSEDTKVHATDANLHDSVTNNAANDNTATSSEVNMCRCLFVCLFVCPWLHSVRFGQLLRYTDKRIADILKVYIERKNIHVVDFIHL